MSCWSDLFSAHQNTRPIGSHKFGYHLSSGWASGWLACYCGYISETGILFFPITRVRALPPFVLLSLTTPRHRRRDDFSNSIVNNHYWNFEERHCQRANSNMGRGTIASASLFVLPVAVSVGLLLGLDAYRASTGQARLFLNDKVKNVVNCQTSYGINPTVIDGQQYIRKSTSQSLRSWIFDFFAQLS